MKSKCHPRSARGARGDWARTKANGIRREAAGGEGSAQPLPAAAAAPAPPSRRAAVPGGGDRPPVPGDYRVQLGSERGRAGGTKGAARRSAAGAAAGEWHGPRRSCLKTAPAPPRRPPRPRPAPPGTKAAGGRGTGRAPGYRAPGPLSLRPAVGQKRFSGRLQGGGCEEGSGSPPTVPSAPWAALPRSRFPAAQQRGRRDTSSLRRRGDNGHGPGSPLLGLGHKHVPGFVPALLPGFGHRALRDPSLPLWESEHDAPEIHPCRSRNPSTVLLGSIRAALRVRAWGDSGIHPCPIPGSIPAAFPN